VSRVLPTSVFQLAYNLSIDNIKCDRALGHNTIMYVNNLLFSPQIEVSTPEVFQVLELCSIFGLAALETHCVDRIMAQLNTNNVCNVLTMAVNLVQKGSSCFNTVVDRCVMYIELHAKEVVETEGFLLLSRETLIQLISSDKVSYHCRCYNSG